MLAASGIGFFVPEFYARNEPSVAVQGVGQDLVNIILAVPMMIVSAILIARGLRWAIPIWLGSVVYTAYSYVIYVFDTAYNQLFLVYVAVLGCSIFALIYALSSVGTEGMEIESQMRGRPATKAMAITLFATAVLFYWLWLSDEIPAIIHNGIPESIQRDKLLTNPVHALDLGLYLPAMIIAAVGLWRRRSFSYVLAPSLLLVFIPMGAAIISMMQYMIASGMERDTGVVLFLTILIALATIVAAWYLIDMEKQMKRSKNHTITLPPITVTIPPISFGGAP